MTAFTRLLQPAHLKSLCTAYGLLPSKQYGQNYLVSEGAIQNIVAAADIHTGDTLVEVGPGFGVLTLALVESGAAVVSFEIEKKLQPYWDTVQSEHANLRVVWGNVLHQFDAVLLPGAYKVIANLPYQITSQVIRLFLERPNPPTRMVVMVQKEVAERIVAKPGDMSLLAVSVQYFGVPKIVSKVAAGSFWPAPKVDSAILAVTDIVVREGSEQFFRVVRAGFENKRKQLWRNLSVGFGLDKEVVQQVLKQVTGNERIRAQELSIAQWKDLVARLGV